MEAYGNEHVPLPISYPSAYMDYFIFPVKSSWTPPCKPMDVCVLSLCIAPNKLNVHHRVGSYSKPRKKDSVWVKYLSLRRAIPLDCFIVPIKYQYQYHFQLRQEEFSLSIRSKRYFSTCFLPKFVDWLQTEF